MQRNDYPYDNGPIIDSPSTAFSFSDQALVAALSAVQFLAILADLASKDLPDRGLAAISSGIALTSYLIAGALHHYSGMKAKRSSSTLLFFWLFSIIASLIQFRTKLALHFPQRALGNFIPLCFTGVLQVAIFSLECLQPDTSSGYIKLGEDGTRVEVPYI